MKLKIFIALLACTTFSFALTIDEAVEYAMQNNHTIKQSEFDFLASQERTSQQQASFLPRVDLYYNYSERNRVLSPTAQKRDSAAGVRMTYNLFNGLSDKYGVDSAKFVEQNRYLLYSATKRDIALETKNRFVEYLKTYKNQEIAKSSLDMFEKHFTDASNYFEQGLIARNELLEVEVQMLEARQLYRSAQRQVEIAKKSLENIIGMDIDTPIQDIYLEAIELKYAQMQEGLIHRDEVAALQNMTQSVHSAIKANRGNFLPQANIALSHSEYGNSWDLSSQNSPNSQRVASLELQWNIFAGGAHRSQEKIYRHEASGLSEKTQELIKEIELQFDRSWSQYEMMADNVATAKQALQAAQENYDISQRQFYEGLLKSSDLITANHLLARAKQNYNYAMYDKMIAVYTIKRVAQID